MKKVEKPAPLDNKWLGNSTTQAILQVIGSDDKWHTVGDCPDTPNAIERELQHPIYRGRFIWIKTPFGRRYHGQVK